MRNNEKGRRKNQKREKNQTREHEELEKRGGTRKWMCKNYEGGEEELKKGKGRVRKRKTKNQMRGGEDLKKGARIRKLDERIRTMRRMNQKRN